MTSGGSRNRSGPKPTDSSLNAARRGLEFDTLPAAGFAGPAPDFPFSKVNVYYVYKDDKGKPVREFDEDATQERYTRELELWAWAWSTPQAAAWIGEPWRWHAVAMWVRTAVICESEEAQAADKNSLHRFSDQIGLTPAGLKENGWKIASAVAEPAATGTSGARKSSSRARLKVVGNGG